MIMRKREEALTTHERQTLPQVGDTFREKVKGNADHDVVSMVQVVMDING